MDPFDPGAQPAGRAPAPGRLGYVQAFLNSFYDLPTHGPDRWATPAGYGAWLAERGLLAGRVTAADRDRAVAVAGRVTAADRDRAVAVAGRVAAADRDRAVALREALRALCLAHHDGAPASEALATVDAIGRGLALAPRFGADGEDRLEPAGGGPDGALALALGVVLTARADGTWSRLKACPHARCGWAFYDHSRNRSGQWCSMRVCGNRTKGEAFRRRRHRDAARTSG